MGACCLSPTRGLQEPNRKARERTEGARGAGRCPRPPAAQVGREAEKQERHRTVAGMSEAWWPPPAPHRVPTEGKARWGPRKTHGHVRGLPRESRHPSGLSPDRGPA